MRSALGVVFGELIRLAVVLLLPTCKQKHRKVSGRLPERVPASHTEYRLRQSMANDSFGVACRPATSGAGGVVVAVYRHRTTFTMEANGDLCPWQDCPSSRQSPHCHRSRQHDGVLPFRRRFLCFAGAIVISSGVEVACISIGLCASSDRVIPPSEGSAGLIRTTIQTHLPPHDQATALSAAFVTLIPLGTATIPCVPVSTHFRPPFRPSRPFAFQLHTLGLVCFL